MAGITLSGTTLRCEDDANADSSLDGAPPYSFKDFALKDAVNCVDLATSQQTYRGVAGIQVGDGVGSAITTLKDQDAAITFNASRTLNVSGATGVANRTVELGNKILGPNGKPSGKNGCKLTLQALTTLRGTVKLRACHIKQLVGAFNVTPGVTGLPGELIDCIIEAAGVVGIGNSTLGELAEVYNLDISLLAALAAVTQWNVTKAERVTIFGDGQRLISTGATVRIRDLVLGGTPTVADVRNTGVNQWDFAEVTWTAGAPQVDLGNYVNEWWRLLRTALNGNTLAPIPNMPIMALDKNGATVMPLTYTDSLGNVTYGGSDPTTKDCIMVRRNLNSVWEELGPFTVRYNRDGITLPNVLPAEERIYWPRVTGAFGDQLRPIIAPVYMVPLGGTGSAKEEYRATLA